MEFVCKGRRTYGVFVETTASMVYCAFRSPGDLFLDGKRGDFRSIAHGLQTGAAAWAIDDATLTKARRKGVKFIAVYVRKLRWYFITPIENFYDPKLYYRRNYASRGGSDQRYLSTDHWQQRNQPCNFR